MKSMLVRIGLVTALAFLVPPARAAVTFVQEADQAARSVTTVKQSLRASTTAGNLLVVGILYDTTVAVSSVVDSQGNSYAAVSNPALGSAVSGDAGVFYARNIHGGADTVTVTLSKAALFADVYVLEYSGADTTNPLDAATGAGGTGKTGSSGAVTTTSPNDLVFGMCADGGGVPSPGTGLTLRSMGDDNIIEDTQTTAAGSYTVTADLGGSYEWVCQSAAFRPAGAPTSASTTESVALSASFKWDNGAAIQGTVSLFQQTASGSVNVGQWPISRQGSVSATLTLQVWGIYRFELHDTSGNLVRSGVIMAFPTLQSGSVQVVLVSSTNQVKSTKFTVVMGDLITTGP